MARTRTLTNLMADIRYQADIENQTARHTDPNLTRLINQSYGRFRELLSDHGHGYYLAEDPGSTVAGTATISLPSDNVRIYGLDLEVNGETRSLIEYNLLERNQFKSWTNTQGEGIPYTFRIQAPTTATLVPTPDAVYAYTWFYLPVFTDLSSGSDTIDGINGWEDWIVYDVCTKVLTRDDDDEQLQKVVGLLRKREAEILHEAGKRSVVTPPRRLDTRAQRRRGHLRARTLYVP
jgi:hypothetical protein